MLVVLLVLWVAPLLCWALAARTVVIGRAVGVALGVCVVAEIVLAETSVFVAGRITLVSALVLVTVALLGGGVLAEWRRTGGRPAGGRGAGTSTPRWVAGRVLSTGYGVLSLCGVLLVAGLVSLNGVPASTPSAVEVEPLPAGVVVAGDQDLGCGSGSQTICTRDIEVRSASGGSSAAVTAAVTAAVVRGLETSGGWQLAPDGNGGRGACRTEGWLLDRTAVCVDVATLHGAVTVTLERSDSW